MIENILIASPKGEAILGVRQLAAALEGEACFADARFAASQVITNRKEPAP
jgi:hypothetical protein